VDLLWTRATSLTTKKTRAAPDPSQYRPILDEAVRLTDERRLVRLAMWAVLEMRLGHEEMVQSIVERARQLPHAEIAVPLALHLAASADKRLDSETRERFAAEWDSIRGKKPAPRDIVESLEIVAADRIP